MGFLFLGNEDLFAAVAVSGTASMFLAPVVFFNILGGLRVRPWAFAFSFALAIVGGAVYMLEAGNHITLIEPLFGLVHKYAKLLLICAFVLAGGCGAFALAARGMSRKPAIS